MVADNINHTGAALQMNTGEQAFSRPSLGSWLVYGLGTENQNLPAFVVVSPAAVFQGAQLWSSSFLPSAYQGTLVRDLDHPIANLSDPFGDVSSQRAKLDAIGQLNRLHKRDRVIDSQLDAPHRILRAGLPHAARRAGSLRHRARERGDTKRSTGSASRRPTCSAGSVSWPVGSWSGACATSSSSTPRRTTPGTITAAIRENLPKRCAAVDRPIAALLCDLKARGLLEDTLVLWGGEFGRTPTAEGTNGREHHPFGFTMWMAGGGVRPGHVHGATDEFGWHAVQDKVHVHDLHATILHIMGFDHERLTYRHGGRDYRLTDVHGHVVRQILAV